MNKPKHMISVLDARHKAYNRNIFPTRFSTLVTKDGNSLYGMQLFQSLTSNLLIVCFGFKTEYLI